MTVANTLQVIERNIDELIHQARENGLEQEDINAIVDLMEKSEERLVALLGEFGVEFGDERVD